MSEFICGDCMAYLPKFADGEFDLAITDPPYGGGFTADAADAFGSKRGRFGGVFDRYFETDAGGGQIRRLLQTSSVRGRAGRGRRSTRRTGVSLTMTYAIGISRPNLRTSRNCSAYRRIKSSGAATTSTCRRRAASSCGARRTSPPRASRWRLSSTHGHRSTATPNASRNPARGRRANRAYTRRRSQLSCTCGCWISSPNRACGYSTRTWAAVHRSSHVSAWASSTLASRSTERITESQASASKRKPRR